MIWDQRKNGFLIFTYLFLSVQHAFYFHALGITQRFRITQFLQFLLPFLLPSLTSCSVAFWPVLCWFWLLWGSRGLDIFQSCPWKVMVATLIDSSLEQAPQDRLPPHLGGWLPSWAGMPGCNWLIHKSGLSAQRKALSLPYPSQTVSAYL